MEEELRNWTKRLNKLQLRLQTMIKMNSSAAEDSIVKETSLDEYGKEAALLRARVNKALREALGKSRITSGDLPAVAGASSSCKLKRSSRQITTCLTDSGGFMLPYRRLPA